MLAPFFRLEISNPNEELLFSAESLNAEGGWDLNGLIISGVEWDETDCKCDELRLTVNNYDLSLQDSPLFAEGNNVDLWMGYDGHQPEYIGRGIVVEKEPTFQDGPAMMEVRCYDIAHFLMEEGRAEIQEEGSVWWERQRVQNTGGDEEIVNDIITDAIPDNDEQIEQRRRQAQAAGLDPSIIPNTSIGEIGPEVDPSRQSVHVYSAHTSTPTTPDRPPGAQFQLRKTNPGKRRRKKNDGKVWRGMTDSEIASTIFNSYGIIPYTQATNESRRRMTTRQVENNVDPNIVFRGRLADSADAENAEREMLRTFGLEEYLPEGNVSDDADSHDLSQEPIYVEGTEPPPTQAQTETVEVERKVVQKKGTSDWDFLKKLAGTHNYIVFVFFDYPSRRWIGYFGPQSSVPQWTVYHLHYARGEDTSLRSIKPRISMRNQSTEIDLIYVDPVSRKENRLRVEISGINRFNRELTEDRTRTNQPLGQGPEVVLSIHGQRVRTMADRRFSSAEDARRWLMAFWYRYAQEFCEFEGDCMIGLPELHARQRHELTGIGQAAGDFFFSKVTHSMRSGEGYQTKLSGFRVVDELGRMSSDSALENTMGEPAVTPPGPSRDLRDSLRMAGERTRERWRRQVLRMDQSQRARQ